MQRKHRPIGRQSQLPSGTLTTMLGESDFSNSRLTRRRHGMNAMVSTELTSRWVCVSGGDFSAETDAQRQIIPGIQSLPAATIWFRSSRPQSRDLRGRREAHTTVQAVKIRDRA